MPAPLAELQTELETLDGRVQAMAKEYQEARAKDPAANPWSESRRKEWSELNAELTGKRREAEQLELDAEVAARSQETQEWLERRGREPRRRPGKDDVPAGAQRSYGDLGLDGDQARNFELASHDSAVGFAAWATHGMPRKHRPRFTSEHMEAVARSGIDPVATELAADWNAPEVFARMQRQMRNDHSRVRELPDARAIAAEARAIEARNIGSLGTKGGYLSVGASMVNAIEIAILTYGPMLAEAETRNTETGEEMSWPVVDDSSNEAAYVGESQAQSTASVDPGFQQVVWRSHDFSSNFVKVPFRQMRDSMFALEPLIGALVGERFGRKFNREATLGQHKVRGIIPRTPSGQVAGSATAIDYEDLIGLEHSLEPSQRPGAVLMLHDAILEQIRLLSDSQGRPLLISNYADGFPATILGRRFLINQHMDGTLASGKKTVLIGRVNQYKWRRVGQLRMRRLVERFAEEDCTAFLGLSSGDGNLLRPNTDALAPCQLLVH